MVNLLVNAVILFLGAVAGIPGTDIRLVKQVREIDLTGFPVVHFFLLQ